MFKIYIHAYIFINASKCDLAVKLAFQLFRLKQVRFNYFAQQIINVIGDYIKGSNLIYGNVRAFCSRFLWSNCGNILNTHN